MVKVFKNCSSVLVILFLLILMLPGGCGESVTTAPAGSDDATPDAFTFVDQTNVTLSTPTESAAITVSSISAASTIRMSMAQARSAVMIN